MGHHDLTLPPCSQNHILNILMAVGRLPALIFHVMTKKLSLLASLSLIFTLPSYGLKSGDEVAVDALAQADFIQGKAPEKWNKNEVYIFECWATWCGPCIAAIPHMDKLYDKYHEKGLNVYGMNVLEDGREKVSKFVNKKGDGMSYPVAYVGRDGEFDTSWIKAAGVRGIPHAFVVKNGKLILTAHPQLLKEDLIIALLAGGEKEKAAIQKLQSVKASKEEITKAVQVFRAATYKKDLNAMRAAYKEIEKLIPNNRKLADFQIEIMLMAKDWAGIEKITNSMDETQTPAIARNLGFRLDGSKEIPDSLRKMILTSLKSPKKKNFFDAAIVARQLWALGEKEQARAFAKKLIKNNPQIPEKVATDFANSFETDHPNSIRELSKALGAAMKK